MELVIVSKPSSLKLTSFHIATEIQQKQSGDFDRFSQQNLVIEGQSLAAQTRTLMRQSELLTGGPHFWNQPISSKSPRVSELPVAFHLEMSSQSHSR
jgi:hypothetical protein